MKLIDFEVVNFMKHDPVFQHPGGIELHKLFYFIVYDYAIEK